MAHDSRPGQPSCSAVALLLRCVAVRGLVGHSLGRPDRQGVWDSTANGWHALGLSKDHAHATTDDLDLQYHGHARRLVRRVDPGQLVDRDDWQPAGTLESGSGAAGQWFGRVRANGRTTWIPPPTYIPMGDLASTVILWSLVREPPDHM